MIDIPFRGHMEYTTGCRNDIDVEIRFFDVFIIATVLHSPGVDDGICAFIHPPSVHSWVLEQYFLSSQSHVWGSASLKLQPAKNIFGPLSKTLNIVAHGRQSQKNGI